MTDTKEDIVIFIRKKPEWQIFLSAGGTMLAAPFLFGNALFEYFTKISEIDEITLIFITAIFFITEFFAIKVFLWNYRGQEKITINANEFKHEKKGSILDFPVTYKLEKIKGFSLAEKKRFENFYRSGLSGGEIQFEYFGEIIKFGQSLSRKEAKEIINQLNQEIINNEPLTNAIANAGLRVR